MTLVVTGQLGFSAADSAVHGSGDIELLEDYPDGLGFGGVQAAIDVWQSDRGEAHLPAYQFKPDPSWQEHGDRWWGDAHARILSAYVDDSGLKPEGLQIHLWDNLAGNTPFTYHTTLTKSVELTDSVTWTKKLSVSDTVSVNFEVSGGPIKAGGSNSLTVGAEMGKDTTHSKSVTVGTEDGSEATIPPGKADLLVLSALTGPLSLVVEIETYWVGSILWRRNSSEEWRQVSLDVLMEHGLARPLDPDGEHGGRETVTMDLGEVSEIDQTAIGVTDTSKAGLAAAEAHVLTDRFPPGQRATVAGGQLPTIVGDLGAAIDRAGACAADDECGRGEILDQLATAERSFRELETYLDIDQRPKEEPT